MYGGYNPYERRYPQQLDPSEAAVIAQMIMQLQNQRQAVQSQALGQQGAFNAPDLYYRFGNTMPHQENLSPMARFKDMALRQQARLASAKAAVDAVKAKQEAEKAAEDEKKGKLSADTRELMGSGKASVKRGDPREPVFYDNGTELKGEKLREFFQRGANAGSPNAGVGSIPLPEPGYQGVPYNDENIAAAAAREAVIQKQMASPLGLPPIVPPPTMPVAPQTAVAPPVVPAMPTFASLPKIQGGYASLPKVAAPLPTEAPPLMKQEQSPKTAGPGAAVAHTMQSFKDALNALNRYSWRVGK